MADWIKPFGGQRFEGVGTIIPFKCTLHGTPNEKIFRGKIARNNLTEKEYEITVNENFDDKFDSDGNLNIKFNILIQKPGEYNIVVDFECTDGQHFIKSFNTTVYSNTYQNLNMMKIRRRSWDEIIKHFFEVTNNGSSSTTPMDDSKLFEHIFSQVDDDYDKTIFAPYRQFLATSASAFQDKLGTNHLLIYVPEVSFDDDTQEHVIKYRLDIDSDMANTGLQENYTLSYNYMDLTSLLTNIHTDITNCIDGTTTSTETPWKQLYPKYKFFILDKIHPNIKLILYDLSNSRITDTTSTKNINNYKRTKNIKYIYNWMRYLQSNLTDTTLQDYLKKYFIVVPYIYILHLPFDNDPDNTLVQNRELKYVANGKSYSMSYSLLIDNKDQILHITPKGSYQKITVMRVKTNKQSSSTPTASSQPAISQYEFEEYTLPQYTPHTPGTPGFYVNRSGIFPTGCIIDDKVTFRVYFSNTVYIEQVIDIPILVDYDNRNINDMTSEDHIYSNIYIDKIPHKVILNKYTIQDNLIEHIIIRDRSTQKNTGTIYNRHVFIPFFHEAIPLEDKVLEYGDVISFTPDLKMLKYVQKTKPNPITSQSPLLDKVLVGWDIYNQSTHKKLQIEKYRDEIENRVPIPIQQFFGNDNLKIIPSSGFYNVSLKYSLDSKSVNIVTCRSAILVKK